VLYDKGNEKKDVFRGGANCGTGKLKKIGDRGLKIRQKNSERAFIRAF
jgi:hypothetical protein